MVPEGRICPVVCLPGSADVSSVDFFPSRARLRAGCPRSRYTASMLSISRGFIAALGGIAMTLLAWFGSWAWPGWPASVAIDLLGKWGDFAELPRLEKSAIVVLLIIINVGTW